MALRLSGEARAILSIAAGEAGAREAYLVGGSLRDSLLAREVGDLDLAVSGDAPAYARALADRLGGHYVLLDAGRGTARVVRDSGDVRVIDVATLRENIEGDLGLRDFTIDALAVPLGDLEEERVIDPHGGRRDLEAGAVRLVSEQALLDDPLRMLRAVRIAVQLSFEVVPDTLALLQRHAPQVSSSSAERQRDELSRCFATDNAAVALRLLDRSGLLAALFPEIAAGRGVDQPKEHHYYDVFDHNIETAAALDWMLSEQEPPSTVSARLWRTLWQAFNSAAELRRHLTEPVVEGRSRSTLLKVAGFLHDVAKPETRVQEPSGRVRFLGHSELGAEMARAILQRLRFGRREIDLVATMVAEHLRPGQLSNAGPPTRRALYRYFRDTGECAESVLLLFLADGFAARGPETNVEAWQRQVAYVAYVLARRYEDEQIVRPTRYLSGEEIMTLLSIAQGREVGRLLAALEEAQASGEVASRGDAVAFVKGEHASQEPALAGTRGAS